MAESKVKNFIYIASSKCISVFVAFVRGFLVPGYLGPKMYGVISLLHLVKIALGFFNMSMGGAYFRLTLDMKGKKEEESKLRTLENNVFSFLAISAVLGTIVTFFIPFIFKREDIGLQKLMIFCFSITALQHFFTLMGSFFYTVNYIDKRFKLISMLNAMQPVLSLILILSTIFYWKIYGVFLAELIAVIVVQSIYFYKSRVKPKFSINGAELKKTFLYALPFFTADIGWYFIRFSDRTIISIYLPLEELGIFSFAANLTYHLRIATRAIGEVISPYFFELLGKEKILFNLAGRIKNYTKGIAATGGLIYLNAIIFCPLIKFVLPKYVDSIIVLKILLIVAYVISIPWLQTLLLGSPKVRKQKYVTITLFISGVINVGVSIFLLKIGFGIVGIAVGTLIANIVQTTLYLSLSHHLYMRFRETFFYLKLFFPIFLLILALFIFEEKTLICFRNGILVLFLNAVWVLYFRKELQFVLKTVRRDLKLIK